MPGVLSTTQGTHRGAFTPTDWALFLTIGLVWGSSFLWIAYGLDRFEPGLITWWRIGAGALALWSVPAARTPVAREDRPRLIALSFLWVGVPFTLLPLAQSLGVTSAVNGMLNGALPVLAVLVGSFMLRRGPTRPQIAGLVLGSAGIAMIALPASGEGSSEATGVLLTLGAVCCYAFAINIAAPLQQKYGSLPVMARMLALATVWTAPFGVSSLGSSSFGWGPALAVTILGVAGTGLAFVLMGILVGRVGGPRASFATYLIPVVALALGVVLLHEHVAAVSIGGAGLVITGAVLASRADRRAAPG
ncbi:MAG: DMT family transporter [Actinomycetota bacterium]